MKASAVARFARNAYEVLSKLPKHGVGSRLQKKTWQEDSYWDVVKVQMELSGASGKSYGMLTWRGTRLHEEPRRIPGTRKKVWRVLEEGAGVRSGFEAMDSAVLESLVGADPAENTTESHAESHTTNEDNNV